MTDINIDVSGIKELDRALKNAGPKAARAALKAGIRAAARVYIKDMRKRLPANYRTLRKSLGTRVKRLERNGTQIRAIVGPSVGRGAKYDGWYAHIVEGGAEWPEIGLKRKKLLVETLKTGGEGTVAYGRVFGTRAQPNPLPARPFMRPAFSAKGNEAIKAMGAKIWQRLEKLKKP